MVVEKKDKNTKGVIRNCKSKMDRQHNCQRKKDKRINNALQNIGQTTQLSKEKGQKDKQRSTKHSTEN